MGYPKIKPNSIKCENYMIDRNDPNRKGIIYDVLKTIEEQDINYVRLQFTDIHGILKSYAVRSKDLEGHFESGAYFDGSSITGYGQIEESDKVAIPDPTTFTILPWREPEQAVCRMICDIYNPDLTRYEGDPRFVLQKAVQKATDMGFEFFCAPELEFFILNEDYRTVARPSDMRGYFDFDPSGINEIMRRQMSEYALQMGIEVECLHHEVATGQHEIDFHYGPAVDTADSTVSLKMIVKIVAAQNGQIGTFMPKPFYGVNGSGMHVHQSLWKGGTNLFYDENDPDFVSPILKQFIAGQLKYAREMTAVLASWPNSYKRLVPGYEAPVYVAWDTKNRSALIRIPNFGGKASAARCEIRCPDPAGNPYLQFAALLHMGLKGIEEKLDPGEATSLNIFHLSSKEMKKMDIAALPGSLGEALNLYEESEAMKECFGELLFKNYLYAKLEEFDAYRMQVHPWELTRYMNKI